MVEEYSLEDPEAEVPVGYKKTELGIIPEDWEIHSLGNLCSCQNGKAQEEFFNSHDGYKVVSIGNYSESGKYIETGIYIDKGLKNEVGRFVLSSGDLAMTLNDKTAVGTIIGRVLLIDLDETYIMNQRTMRLTPKEGVISKYLHFLINSDSVHNRIIGMAKPGTQIYVNTDDVLSFSLSLPNSKKEQTAIATALSDMDALIESLDKLIEKKRQLKQATMQQLLTGKTRLPQFALREDGSPKAYKQSELGEIPEDWEIKQFGELLSIRHGRSQKEVESSSGKYPIFATGGLIGFATDYLWNKPSVLIGRKGTIDKPRYIDQPFWTVDTLFYSEIKHSNDARFIYYKFCMIEWMQYNEASGVPSLNANTIEKVSAIVPGIDEQKAISSVLEDMDCEINFFKQRRHKTQQLKQGMMQELLTGKTRLIKPETINGE